MLPDLSMTNTMSSLGGAGKKTLTICLQSLKFGPGLTRVVASLFFMHRQESGLFRNFNVTLHVQSGKRWSIENSS
jgi:hypothetical protein